MLLTKLFDLNMLSSGYFTTALLIFVLILIFRFRLKKFDRNRFFNGKIPGMKIRMSNILGHISFLSRGNATFGIYPRNTYLLQLLESFRNMYIKENCFAFWMFYNPFVILTKAETAEELLTSTSVLEKAWSYNMLHPWLGTGLLTSKGPKWKLRRKLLTPSFHFDILKDFLPVFNEKSKILVEVLKEETEKEWTDIAQFITLCSLDIICETTLGVDINVQKNKDSEYVQAVFNISTATMERMTNPAQWWDFLYYISKTGREYKKNLNILHTFTRKVIQKKKEILEMKTKSEENPTRRKRKALMDLLLDHNMNYQDLTEEDIREEVDTFAFEGHDTTSMGLSWTLFLVGLHEDIQKKVHEELDHIFGGDDRHVAAEDLKDLKYLECVIKESQRLYPSVPFFGRQLNQDLILAGRKIKKGSVCAVYSYGIHRNKEVFPNPEVFDPDRFLPENSVGRHPFAYIPFAAGPRNCIGQRFAMMELKVVLANVLRWYKVKALEQRDEVQASIDLILRPGKTIKMKMISRRKL